MHFQVIACRQRLKKLLYVYSAPFCTHVLSSPFIIYTVTPPPSPLLNTLTCLAQHIILLPKCPIHCRKFSPFTRHLHPAAGLGRYMYCVVQSFNHTVIVYFSVFVTLFSHVFEVEFCSHASVASFVSYPFLVFCRCLFLIFLSSYFSLVFVVVFFSCFCRRIFRYTDKRQNDKRRK